MELGKEVKTSSIVVNGTQTSQTDSENMYGVMEIFMKVNGKHV
jgi:hypothetical protein